MLSATCGVPVTATPRLNVTRAVTRSPRSYVVPSDGAVRLRPVTTGPPSTLWFASFAMAFVPSPSVAAVDELRPSLIAPLFSVSADAATLMPSGSQSPAAAV